MDASDPRHGTPAGYTAHRIAGVDPCDACVTAHTRAGKARKYAGRRRRVKLGVDAHRILLAYTDKQVADAAGLARNTVQRLRRQGPSAGVLVATKAKILASRPPYSPTGIQRRLRALARLGWSISALAEALGTHNTVIADTQNSARLFQRNPDLADRIVALYETAEHTPLERSGPTTLARRRAERLGWHAPATWDDIDTDPEPEMRRRRSGWQPTHVLENYDFLIASGESHEQALKQLGVTNAAVERARYRALKAQEEAA